MPESARRYPDRCGPGRWEQQRCDRAFGSQSDKRTDACRFGAGRNRHSGWIGRTVLSERRVRPGRREGRNSQARPSDPKDLDRTGQIPASNSPPRKCLAISTVRNSPPARARGCWPRPLPPVDRAGIFFTTVCKRPPYASALPFRRCWRQSENTRRGACFRGAGQLASASSKTRKQPSQPKKTLPALDYWTWAGRPLEPWTIDDLRI